MMILMRRKTSKTRQKKRKEKPNLFCMKQVAEARKILEESSEKARVKLEKKREELAKKLDKEAEKVEKRVTEIGRESDKVIKKMLMILRRRFHGS